MSFRPQGEIFAFNGYSTLYLEDFSSCLLEMTLFAACLVKIGMPYVSGLMKIFVILRVLRVFVVNIPRNAIRKS